MVACVVVEVKVQQRRPDGGSIPPIARIVILFCLNEMFFGAFLLIENGVEEWTLCKILHVDSSTCIGLGLAGWA